MWAPGPAGSGIRVGHMSEESPRAQAPAPVQLDANERIRAGFCAIVGLPNAGKSTLLNQVLGFKLVAVSPKPQTTRNSIIGVKNLTAEEAAPAGAEPDLAGQIVFTDTPGLQRGPGALRRFMREESLGAAVNCDVALLVLDLSDRRQREGEVLVTGGGADREEGGLAAALADIKAPVILALNKVDRVKDKSSLLAVLERFGNDPRFAAVVPISAINGKNVDRLLGEIASRLPESPRLFPEEMVTDRAERFLAGELIREQLFVQLGKELPYASAVVIESFRERPSRKDVVIEAIIYVERDSQKGIVVGRGGTRIKELGQKARAEVSALLGCPVHIKLFVKVDPEWSRADGGIRRMGYGQT